MTHDPDLTLTLTLTLTLNYFLRFPCPPFSFPRPYRGSTQHSPSLRRERPEEEG